MRIPGAIRGMKRRQPHTGASDAVNHAFEFLQLFGRERLVWFVRGGEMRENAGKAKNGSLAIADCKGSGL